MRAPRAWAAAALGIVFAAQIASYVTAAFERRLGAPGLAEIRAALPAGSSDVVDVGLEAAERRERDDASRKVALGPEWNAALGRLSIRVFVDGDAIGLLSDEPEEIQPARRPYAYRYYLSRRAPRLAIVCPSDAACKNATVAGQTRRVALWIALGRFRNRTGLLLALVAGVVLWTGLARMSLKGWRGHAPSVASWLALAALAAWFGGRAYERPWAGAATLALETLGLAAPLVWRVAGALDRTVFAALARGCDRLARRLETAHVHVWGPLASTLVTASLFLPTALRGRTFFSDWANHLYYVTRQTESIRHLAHPSYFLHSDLSGLFYPYFAFYGGSLYAVTGALGSLVGPAAAYIAAFGVGFAMAHGGLTWLGRLAGLAPALAPLPALVFISSAYYLTNDYGRGSWPEFMATSAIPLLLASGLSLVTAPRTTARDAGLVLVSAFLMTGSHTITLVWGSVFVALLSIGGLRAHWPRWRSLALLAGLGAAINAWFLVPSLAYGRATHIGAYAARGFGSDTQFLNVPRVLFHPGRLVPAESGTVGLYTQVSIYALAWSLLAGVLLLRRAERPSLRRAWLVLATLLAVFLALVLTGRLDWTWAALPRILKIVQFQFRLHTYVGLCVAGLALVGLRAIEHSGRRAFWVGALLAALAVQVALAERQAWTAITYYPVSRITEAGAHVPPTLTEAHDYRFRDDKDTRSLGERVFPAPAYTVNADPDEVRGDRLTIRVPGALGNGPIRTNVNYSPFVAADGEIVIAGRTPEGFAVIERRSRSAAGDWSGTIGPAWPRAVALGTAASLVALVLSAAVLARLGARQRSAGAPVPLQ